MVSGKVSIIIPLYNGRRYIFNTVATLSKLRADKEIIVVDDGSKDGSEEYCKELCEKYKDVKVVRKENGGICSARNYGLSICTGEYVMFVDQDDDLDTDNLAAAIDRVIEEKADALFWSCNYGVNGEMTACDEVASDASAGTKEIRSELLPALVFREKSAYTSFLGHVWAGIYSAEMIASNEIRFKFFIDYEDDQLFVFDVLRVAKKISFFKPVVYIWNYNPRSYSNIKRRLDDIVPKYESYFEYLRKGCEEMRPDFPGNKLDEFRIWEKQFTFCEAVRNSGISGEMWKQDLKKVKMLEKQGEYRAAIKQEPVHIREKKYRLFLVLSKMKMTGVSVRLSRLYFRRKLKKVQEAQKNEKV